MAAEVILKEIIQTFSDLPVTVAPVAGDLDRAWHGTNETLRVAKAIFAAPNVEAGSHTYGHPLNWEESGAQTAATSRGVVDRMWNWWRSVGRGESPAINSPAKPAGGDISRDRNRPTHAEHFRTYNVKPFSLKLEIDDSIRYINGLLPAGKRVQLMQWSGDTMPSEQAIAAARAAGVQNLNGGDTRFDPEFYSYAWVAPLARQVESQRQIYASNSNENTYTELWSDRFFGFKYLTETLKNTETPVRVKPHNIYFHMYSGEKLPSLLAVQANYRYARKQEVAPITAATYAAIVEGFYTARIIRLAKDRWRIEDRGALQTIRFDRPLGLSVDFSRSSGVLGQRLYQDSLYIALDPADPAPVLALGNVPAPGPYLSHARWQISGFMSNGDAFAFTANGFGSGETVWKVRPRRTFLYEVRTKDGAIWQNKKSADATGLLRLDLGPASDPVEVRVTRFQTR
jgi:hypothetical protein